MVFSSCTFLLTVSPFVLHCAAFVCTVVLWNMAFKCYCMLDCSHYTLSTYKAADDNKVTLNLKVISDHHQSHKQNKHNISTLLKTQTVLIFIIEHRVMLEKVNQMF